MINHDFEMFVLCPNCNKEIWNYGFVKQRPWDSLSPINREDLYPRITGDREQALRVFRDRFATTSYTDVMEHRLVCGINEHETGIIEFDCPDCDFATESCVYLKLKRENHERT